MGRNSVSFEEAQHCWLGFLKDVPTAPLQYLLNLRKHFRLCLLSNTNPFMMAFTRSPQFSELGQPITHFFDRLYCSYEMGLCKPSPDIFLRALSAEGIAPEQALFLDDSTANIEAAAALGIHTLHVPTNAPFPPLLAAWLQEHSLNP